MTENNSNCKSSLSEIQDMLTDITDQVVSVCNANQIPYFLAYGSCLGAVRHKGFIPWDDDIDICLRYQDIRKLKKCMIGNPNLFFQDLQTDPEYFQTFSKVRKNGTTSMDPELKSVKMHWGICIDLFPLMEYDRPKIRKTTFLKLNLVHKLARIPYQAKIKSSAGGKTGHFRLLNQKWREKLFFRLMDSIERKGS